MTIQTDEYTWKLEDEKIAEAASILDWNPEDFARWLTVKAEENLLEEDFDKHQQFLTEATAEQLAEWVDNDYELWIRAQER